MASIVEYSSSKKPLNGYPKRIISPSCPQSCCAAQMVQVGRVQENERGFPFYYRRCQACGFTVRYFLPVFPPEAPPQVHPKRRRGTAVENVA